MGRLIEGGGVGRPAGKNLKILDLHRLASLQMYICEMELIKTILKFHARQTEYSCLPVFQFTPSI